MTAKNALATNHETTNEVEMPNVPPISFGASVSNMGMRRLLETGQAISCALSANAGADKREEVIEVTPNLKHDYPRAFELARQGKFRIVWLRPDLVYCARKSKGHGEYLIRFFATQRIQGDPQVKTRCNSTAGVPCKGTEFGAGPCAHICAVLLRAQKKKTKTQERQAA